MDDAPIFTDEDIEFGEQTPILGPEYSAARRFMDGFAESFREEHLQPFTDEITKTIADKVREKVWDDFNNYLLMDTEYNAQGAIRSMVNDTVKALLSGEKWAMERYPLSARYDAEKVRAAIAAHIPDEIAKARIADLEKQVADLQERLNLGRKEDDPAASRLRDLRGARAVPRLQPIGGVDRPWLHRGAGVGLVAG